jgi:hypothetical protein
MAIGGKLIYAIEKPEHAFSKSIAEIAEKFKKM